MNVKQIDLTKEGKKALEDELEFRTVTERDRIKEAIKVAREQGDLSENAEYSAAKDEQRVLNARLAEIEDILKNHEIIREEWYTVKYEETGLEKSFQLVGVLEADPLDSKISKESPIGKAIQGHKVGDTITFSSGSGKKITVTIVKRGK